MGRQRRRPRRARRRGAGTSARARHDGTQLKRRPPPADRSGAAPLVDGTVIAAFGRSYLVRLDSGETITCFPRGKRSEIACGDRLRIAAIAPDQGVVEAITPRSSLLYRSDAFRQKLIAANVTQVVLVVAAFPSFYEDLLHRCLAAAEHTGIRAIIVLNKCDLDSAKTARASLAPLEALGYDVLPLIARESVAPLRERLTGHLSVLVGQSGMGKSTIVNSLVPEAAAATAEVSEVLDSGKHTTTHARLYRLDDQSAIIDSPGLQEFGLHHLKVTDLDHAFVEFRPYIGGCRFSNCRHIGEPGCAVAAAQAAGTVDPARLDAYRRIAKAMSG